MEAADVAKLVVPLLTFALGLLLRPTIGRFIRRQTRGEEEALEWRERGRQLITSLEALLEPSKSSSLSIHNVTTDRSDEAQALWNVYRAQVKDYWHYAPYQEASARAQAVLLRFERLAKGAFALSKAKNLDGPARNKAEVQYSVKWGEAAQALDEFREANGGRPALPREASIYPLEDDGQAPPSSP